jgi:hypothetical protein
MIADMPLEDDIGEIRDELREYKKQLDAPCLSPERSLHIGPVQRRFLTALGIPN